MKPPAIMRRFVLLLACWLSACGGGSSPITNTNASTNVPTGTNTLPIQIQQFSGSSMATVNIPYVTVSLCDASNHCADIPNVLLDSGSTGFRLLTSALNGTGLNLATVNSGNGVVGECAYFASGYLWGAIREATIQLGQQSTQTSVPIQVIDDSAVPAGGGTTYCMGAATDMSIQLQANGILGVSAFLNDSGNFFLCDAGSCVTMNASDSTATSTGQKPVNPIAKLPAAYSNGIIVQMPATPPTGVTTATGTLLLGINSVSNNQLGSSTNVYALSSQGELNVSVNGIAGTGFIDSGSNGYFVSLAGVPQCSSPDVGFYCPTDPVSLTLQISSGATSSASLSAQIGNTYTLLQSHHLALPELGGPSAISGQTDLGLPFFYGRSIAFGMEGTTLNVQNYSDGFVAF
jgi:Protein of unknown function (DUF3443)